MIVTNNKARSVKSEDYLIKIQYMNESLWKTYTVSDFMNKYAIVTYYYFNLQKRNIC